MIFSIPRGGITYVGTTDTNYDQSKEEVLTTSEDALYLINAINATFPSANLSVNDIESLLMNELSLSNQERHVRQNQIKGFVTSRAGVSHKIADWIISSARM